MSRRLPDKPDFFQINTNDVHASAFLKKPADLRIMTASSEITDREERKTSPTENTPGSGGDIYAQWRYFEGSFEPFLRHACGHSGSTLDQHYANMQSGLICGLCLVAEFGSSVFTENWRGSEAVVLHAHQRQGSYHGRFIRFTTLIVRERSIVQISSPGLSSCGVMWMVAV